MPLFCFFTSARKDKQAGVVLKDFIGLTFFFFFKSTQYSFDIFTVQI